MSHFHDNQITSATDIINLFLIQPFTLLLAQMQSGKTGTYLYLAFEMIRRELSQRVVIICGSSDTSLRKQLNDDLFSAKRAYLDLIDPDGNLPRRLTDIFDNIKVFFSQDLSSIPDIHQDTLIIHDECHMAQSKNNIPFKNFYLKNSLTSALMGDFTLLREKNIHLLGVSATPFSEIVATKKVLTKDWTTEENSLLQGSHLDPKNIYFMKPGPDYIGVSDFISHNQVFFESSEIKEMNCQHLSTILRNSSEKYSQKFCVVRTRCAEKDAPILKTIASSLGYNYTSVFGGGGPSDLDFMREKPFNQTIVHICGRFRMGQVVPKQYIAMVYEQSKDPNADTILQGLLGRMCGYPSSGAHLNVDIFVSRLSEPFIAKYAQAWSENKMDELSNINRAMNLGGVRQKNGGSIVTDKDGNQWIKTVPIKFTIDQLEQDFNTIRFNQITTSDLSNLFEDHPELIHSNPDKDELLCLLRGGVKTHHNKSYRGTESSTVSSDKFYADLNIAVSDSKRINVSSYAQGSKRRTTAEFGLAPLSLYGSEKSSENPSGTCYLMGFVPYDPVKHPPPMVEIASVHPKCNYVPGTVELEDDTILDKVNGGQIITFSLDTAEDPNILESELRSAIQRTDKNHPSFVPSATRSIHSLYDRKTNGYDGIRLEKSIYPDSKLQEIISILELECNVKLNFKRCRGRQPKDYHKYSSISW